MRLLKILFSKKFRQEYSKKLVSEYNKTNDMVEEIYTATINECKELKHKAA